MAKTPPTLDLAELLPSWIVTLKAERKSPQTLKSYGDGVRAFLAWCAEEDVPPVLSKPNVTAFTAALLDAGRSAATATARQLAVRRFSAWLADEGELEADPLLGMKAPKIDQQVIEPLTDEEIRALLKACEGRDLRDRRDTAIIRLMVETGARAGEVAAMNLEDVDTGNGVAIIRRGKGGRGRSVPFGPQTAQALDRYIRARRTHRLASTPALWLGDRGKAFAYDGLHKTLGERAAVAGIARFHPHLLRHTAAHRWLAAGGSEGGLMAVAGWQRPEMLLRYTRARAQDRAAEEARRLNLGEL